MLKSFYKRLQVPEPLDSSDVLKAAGVAIPVFSLRSENSWGIGEFSDLKLMIDWAEKTKQSIIQILPINDTTMSHDWTDSYPYSAISTYALHPAYLGLHEFPLKNTESNQKYLETAKRLNKLPDVDYTNVIQLKEKYLHELFAEIGQETQQEEGYLTFYEANHDWLFPYACFSYLRDLNKTGLYFDWKTNSTYNKQELEEQYASDSNMKEAVDFVYFTQYLLHKQLVSVKDYAQQKGITLKGDVPIGINRYSVEAWSEPHLFNLDTSTGAPPDAFSANGQNWGFPTYKWEEMEKDGYKWWIRRFRKMADYFGAYRIDHILGFFRIWEIPTTCVQGLMGYFSPAMPLSADEIRSSGLWWDEHRMTQPYIHEHFLKELCGEHAQEIMDKYLEVSGWQIFRLKEEFNTEVKIRDHFNGKDDAKSREIRDHLYHCTQSVLFIRDKRQQDKFHPRISSQFCPSYYHLSEHDKWCYNRIYDDYFYHRHTQYWRDQALKKLPVLISSTNMVVCGEDLGMIPKSVPSVMRELKILSLEVERMPKTSTLTFEDLKSIPYSSVVATSTHDMAPIRAWWHEDKKLIQRYYKEVLGREGQAPEDCSGEICHQIVMDHLTSPSMLAILPLQDWMSIDEKIRRDNPGDERINIPSIPDHYWKYRMHLTLGDLMKADSFNSQITTMLESVGRTQKIE